MAKNTKEYMRIYQAARRAAQKGFNLSLARNTYDRLIARGVAHDDALWGIMDAAARGCFGYCSVHER